MQASSAVRTVIFVLLFGVMLEMCSAERRERYDNGLHGAAAPACRRLGGESRHQSLSHHE